MFQHTWTQNKNETKCSSFVNQEIEVVLKTLKNASNWRYKQYMPPNPFVHNLFCSYPFHIISLSFSNSLLFFVPINRTSAMDLLMLYEWNLSLMKRKCSLFPLHLQRKADGITSQKIFCKNIFAVFYFIITKESYKIPGP